MFQNRVNGLFLRWNGNGMLLRLSIMAFNDEKNILYIIIIIITDRNIIQGYFLESGVTRRALLFSIFD